MNFFIPDKEISRKEALKYLAKAGLSFSLPFFMSKKIEAAPISQTHPLWVSIHAGGGWDPTSLIDPKGNANGINSFTAGSILNKANGIKLSPWIDNHDFFDSGTPASGQCGDYIRVINGVDTTTNNHGVGPIYIWSGKITVGNPTWGAIIAATNGAGLPLAFINNGGYAYSAGVAPTTQINNIDYIKEIAQPNIDRDDKYFTDKTFQRIRDFRDARLDALIARQHLPKLNKAMKVLETSHEGEAQLEQFIAEAENLQTRASGTSDFATDYNNNTLVEQFAIAHAAYKADLCAAVNLRIGGFDTHSNHDARHRPILNDIVNGMRRMIMEAGIDKIMIMVGSDFGRTPKYNGSNGKDHWPITSMIVAGSLINGKAGVTGASTDDKYYVDESASPVSAGGSRLPIKPAHVHYSLRKLTGLDSANINVNGSTRTLSNAFPLHPDNEYMPMFGSV